MKVKLKAGTLLLIGCDHPDYPFQAEPIDSEVAVSLASGLD